MSFFLWITSKNTDYLFGRASDRKSFYLVANPNIKDVWTLLPSALEDNELTEEDYKIQIGILFGIDAENTAENEVQLQDKRKKADFER